MQETNPGLTTPLIFHKIHNIRYLQTLIERSAMEYQQIIPKTELARNTRQVLQAVQRGQTAIIESHGQAEAAILEIDDYRILRAVMRYHAQKTEIDPDTGLSAAALSELDDPQEKVDQVLAYYLEEGISLGRAAELLGLPWLDLRTRFLRLDVPILVGPDQPEEVQAELRAIKAWESKDGGADLPG